VGFDPGTSVDAQALTNPPITNVPQVPLGTSTHNYYLKGAITQSQGRGMDRTTCRHGFRGKGQSSLQVAKGMQIEMKLFLGLGVPESDQSVEKIIFG
jgi:hypothetical protein